MRRLFGIVPLLAALAASSADAQSTGLGEVLVNASRNDARFWQKDRPVVGLRRQADGMVMNLTIVSDTRDALTRGKEIDTALLAAIDRAAASGFQLVTGNVQLEPVTKANYTSLPQLPAGRIDTSKVELMVRGKLEGSSRATQERLRAFIGSLKGNGRATVETTAVTSLSVDNPDQYREKILALVAEDARRTAAIFGPDFTFSVSGVDGQVSWTQASPVDVFLYIPYRYAITPRQSEARVPQ
ncbi:MAG: TonB-dependent receptor [Novosphingobium sp.]